MQDCCFWFFKVNNKRSSRIAPHVFKRTARLTQDIRRNAQKTLIAPYGLKYYFQPQRLVMRENPIDTPVPCYKRHNKKIRVNGVSTSISLERYFWFTLEHICHLEKISLGKLCSNLYSDYVNSYDVDGSTNFSSFLRVFCLSHKSNKDESESHCSDVNGG